MDFYFKSSWNGFQLVLHLISKFCLNKEFGKCPNFKHIRMCNCRCDRLAWKQWCVFNTPCWYQSSWVVFSWDFCGTVYLTFTETLCFTAVCSQCLLCDWWTNRITKSSMPSLSVYLCHSWPPDFSKHVSCGLVKTSLDDSDIDQWKLFSSFRYWNCAFVVKHCFELR